MHAVHAGPASPRSASAGEAAWHRAEFVETPAMRYQPVNAWGIPTGRVESRPAASEVLGDKFIDDGYDEVADGSVFALSGGDRRIEVHFDEGYTAAQVFAPGDDDVVCFEPMAAPTDALRRGGYREVQPGESAVAQFRIKIS